MFSCPEGEKVKLKHGNTEGFSYRESCYEFNWTRPDNLTEKALLGKSQCYDYIFLLLLNIICIHANKLLILVDK